MSDTELPIVAEGAGDPLDLKGQFLQLLRSTGVSARDDLINAAEQVAEYAADQALQLAPLVADAGFMLAVEAAAENVLMRSGLRIVAQADASDARFVGLLEGGLAIAARAAAAGLA